MQTQWFRSWDIKRKITKGTIFILGLLDYQNLEYQKKNEKKKELDLFYNYWFITITIMIFCHAKCDLIGTRFRVGRCRSSFVGAAVQLCGSL